MKIAGAFFVVCGLGIAWVDKRADSLLIAAVGGLLVALAVWSENDGGMGGWLSRRQQVLGATLLVLGIGVLVLLLPDVLRYIVQPRARLTDEPLVLAMAAMMIVGGWFLRQPRGR